MNILSYNPGHDGAFAYIEDGHLAVAIEAEKNSHYRHSPLSIPDVFSVLGQLQEVPDVLCGGGWWPGDMHQSGRNFLAGYHGVNNNDTTVGQDRLLGKTVKYFSSSH
jgi:predicted NodU family carbamoyl transferase